MAMGGGRTGRVTNTTKRANSANERVAFLNNNTTTTDGTHPFVMTAVMFEKGCYGRTRLQLISFHLREIRTRPHSVSQYHHMHRLGVDEGWLVFTPLPLKSPDNCISEIMPSNETLE